MEVDINNVLREILHLSGASLVGFADLSQLDCSATNELSRGISIAVAMTPSIVRGISNGATLEYYEEYNKLNSLLKDLVDISCRKLESYGYTALGQTITAYTQSGTYRTALPHKTVATRAGLGWIGKNALLVTKEYGSALRISSVLTDAPLEVATPINESECQGCNQCTSACFAKAIKGINWDISKDRDIFFDANTCRTVARERAARIGLDGAFCGKCIEICPYTQRYINCK
jgi:epoxyqueuosine reductase QueG